LERKMAKEEKELRELKTIEELLNYVKNTLDARLPQLREQVKGVQQRATKATTERPMLALGVAFLVGMALGIAISRRKD
jgi:ElaB/YqjD/DUF883 family membrane-anchored ribosome-binding protein